MSGTQSTTPQLGVCYYPEHWPESQWESDATHMFNLGIRVVRIGEFAWSKFEENPGELTFEWLVSAINVLHSAGLSIVLGTPTATPPRWMLDKYPDMLAIDENGIARGFGSRRHYCFSHQPYRIECQRIVSEMATRFGEHPAVVAWQTDNEYGCHDTIPSYSEAALRGFQQWCEQRYGTIQQLNDAWGNVFWSMDYNAFDQIGFPVAAVTETNPAHRLAFWRYSSDQVVAFNQVQTKVLRKLSPGRDLIHNYMGCFVQFDHHAVSKDLDVATWDNYPIGFLTRDDYSEEEQSLYLRTGHPDSSAFHHDLYRGCNNGRWWLMEQQPGPVNWAPYNPAPLPGMVRFWGWEAIAHGAEVVSYFRWRQCPYAQEQMHTGLLRPDSSVDVGGEEVSVLARELFKLQTTEAADFFQIRKAPIALLFDYTGIEAQSIQQPGGKTFSPFKYAYTVYSACRQLGLDVDIVSSNDDFSGYDVVLLTSNTISDENLVKRLEACESTVVLMPRVGSKTEDNGIPSNLAPGAFQSLIPVKVVRSESLPGFAELPTSGGLIAQDWREYLDTQLEPKQTFGDDVGFHYQHGAVHYLNACLSESSLVTCLSAIFSHANMPVVPLPHGVRIRQTTGAVWLFNFGPSSVQLNELALHDLGYSDANSLMLGCEVLEAGDVAMWRNPSF